MAFDANDYVSSLSMAELNDILFYGANLPTAEQRGAVRDAANRRLTDLRAAAESEPSYGGAGGSGGLVEGDTGGTWDGVYSDGSSISGGGYGGVEGQGTNEIAYDGVTIPEVEGLYQDLLGREADTAGRDYWINSGMTLDQIRDSIMQSQEYQTAQAIRDQEAAAPDDPFVAPGYEGTDTYPGQADFDANAYVADLSIAELRNILQYGANLPTYDQRQAANAAAQAALDAYYADTEPSYGGAGGSGGLIEGETGGTWDGIYIDGSSPTGGGYGGDEGRGTNEIPLPDGINPLPGGPGVQDPTHPGATDWDGANLGQDGGSVVDGQYVPPPSTTPPGSTAPPTNGMGPDGGQLPPTTAPPTTAPPAGGGGDPFVPQGPGYIDSFLPGSRNDPFYTDQFNRLAAQNYDFQNQQALAQQMRANAPPPQAPDFSWADAYAPPQPQAPAQPPTTDGGTGGTVDTGGNYGGANAYPNYGSTGVVAWPWLGGANTTGGLISPSPL